MQNLSLKRKQKRQAGHTTDKKYLHDIEIIWRLRCALEKTLQLQTYSITVASRMDQSVKISPRAKLIKPVTPPILYFRLALCTF